MMTRETKRPLYVGAKAIIEAAALMRSQSVNRVSLVDWMKAQRLFDVLERECPQQSPDDA